VAKISEYIAMPVSLESQVYNLNVPYPAVMVEIGTDENTVGEAKLTAALLAQAVVGMLTL